MAAWQAVIFDEALALRRRFYTEDPLGNRLELVEAVTAPR